MLIRYTMAMVLHFTFTALFLWLTLASRAHSDVVEVDVAVFLSRFPNDIQLSSDTRLLPALEIARETISHRVQTGEYANFTLRWVVTHDNCDWRGVNDALKGAATLYFEGKALAYFGPSCQNYMLSVADFAASMNVPIFSGSADKIQELDLKGRYATVTQTVIKESPLAHFLREVCFIYDWDSFSLIGQGHTTLHTAYSIQSQLGASAGFQVYTLHIEKNVRDYESHLKRASLNSRSKY